MRRIIKLKNHLMLLAERAVLNISEFFLRKRIRDAMDRYACGKIAISKREEMIEDYLDAIDSINNRLDENQREINLLSK